MGEIKVNSKTLVVPGDLLATGMDNLPGDGTYRENDNIHSARLGLCHIEGRAVKVIPVSGNYVPRKNDIIIAKIIDVTMSGWRAELNTAYTAMLTLKEATSEYVQKGADLTKYFNFGDYILTKITNVTTQNLIDISMRGPGLRKLSDGRIIKVSPSKIPRIIGKKGSMVAMVKDATQTNITVGQNGLIWISGKDPAKELLAEKAIEMIDRESHTSGLTERMKTFLGVK
jgi:exosome complex component RRP4